MREYNRSRASEESQLVFSLMFSLIRVGSGPSVRFVRFFAKKKTPTGEIHPGRRCREPDSSVRPKKSPQIRFTGFRTSSSAAHVFVSVRHFYLYTFFMSIINFVRDTKQFVSTA